MQPLATADVIRTDLLLYWMLSVVVLFLMDRYARRKLGGKTAPGYRVLAFPRTLALLFVTLVSVALAVLSGWRQWELSASQMTYLGVPYFTAWFFFLVNVLRRVRAERKRS